MRSFTLLPVVLVTLLVVLQWGGESNAMPSPVPPYYQPYSYQQPQAQPYYTYAPTSYPQQQTPTVAKPSKTAAAVPGEFEGLSDQNAIVGKENIQFTGFDVLGNVNLPANVLSITDVLDSLGGLGGLGR